MNIRKTIACLALAALLLLPLPRGEVQTAAASSPGWAENAAARDALPLFTLTAYNDDNRAVAVSRGFLVENAFLVAAPFSLIENAGWVLATSDTGAKYAVVGVAAWDGDLGVVLLKLLSPCDMTPLTVSEEEADPWGDQQVTAFHGRDPIQCTFNYSVHATMQSYTQRTFLLNAGEVDTGSPLLNSQGEVMGIALEPSNWGGDRPAADFLVMSSLIKTAREDDYKILYTPPPSQPEDTIWFPFPIPVPELMETLEMTPAPTPKPTPTPTPAPRPTPVPKPLPPASVKAAWEENGVMITWDEVQGAKNYSVLRAPKKDGSYLIIGYTQTLSFLDSSADYADYYYKVSVRTSGGLSDMSAAVAARSPYTQSKKVPAPKSLKAKVKLGSVRLTWTAAKGAQSYVILRSDKKNGMYERVGTADENQYTDPGVYAGRTYYYKIRAVSGWDISTQSSAVTAKIPSSAP